MSLNRKKVSKKHIYTLGFLFVAIVIASSFTLIEPTLNYVRFFKAIENLSVKSLEVETLLEQDRITVDFSLEIENPIDYIGLKLKFLSYRLQYWINDGAAEFVEGHQWFHEPIPLDPHLEVLISYSTSIGINREVARNFISFQEDHQGEIEWVLNGTALLQTFLSDDIRISYSYP